MITETQFNTYMKDNLTVDTVSQEYHDVESDNKYYEYGFMYSICVKGELYYQFTSLFEVLKFPDVDYKARAIDIMTDKLDNRFELEELNDRDFTKGTLELLEDYMKLKIKKLDSREINRIAWRTYT